MEFGCNSPQLFTSKAFRVIGEPYLAHSLHMDHASLQGNVWTDNTNGLQQGTVTIAGNGLNIHSKGKQVFQVFLEFFKLLPVGQAVELCELNGIIPKQD
jgi:hypothetical protein